MWLQGTNDLIKVLNEFYLSNYKEELSKYKVELEFTTILTYYSGSCALVLDFRSVPESTTKTDMCVMLECSENDFQDLSSQALKNFFEGKIISKYKGLLKLNEALCSMNINRKVIIKNTSFNESILSVKLEKDILQLELNYNKIIENSSQDQDLLRVIEGMNVHFSQI